MKYFINIIIFLFISCSDTPNEAPIDSYRDVNISIDMSSAIDINLFNKDSDTLKFQLDETAIFKMNNTGNSNSYSCLITNLILGKTYQYQYIINQNIEDINEIRSFIVTDSDNLVLDFYGELNPTVVTFFVNMSYQVELGNFNIENDFVDVAGTFNNWDGSNQLLLLDNYIYTLSVSNIQVGDVLEFKFRINGSCDAAEFPGYGDNRSYTVLQGDNILEYWFNDESDN